MSQYLLAIDQGTTNSRAIIFNRHGNIMSQHDRGLSISYPQEGWVEQDPEEMFHNTVDCCQQAIKKNCLAAKDIAAIGIANQRETTIIWDRHSGKPIYPAIVWQDRRTHDICQTLKKHPIAKEITNKTGLLLDPYFSATKICWLLEHIPTTRKKAENGDLLFGTVDTYLIWQLTGGNHVTDATNAARTLLFNIHTQEWDTDILAALQIPSALLPKVLDCSADFGMTKKHFFQQSIAITGVAGDQQAATIGQACFTPGMVKATYGTGCFMLLNTGEHAVHSNNHLLTTIAYRFHHKTIYGLEGSIFCAGATVKWLRDTLKIITEAHDTEILANSICDNGGVYLVPAFTGLGAPYWQPNARAMLTGLSRNSGVAHIARAALEAVAYQSYDLLTAMQKDSGNQIQTLRVDGGMAANNWLLQFLANILNIVVARPTSIETTALGAAFLAGLHIGMYSSLTDIAKLWQEEINKQPNMLVNEREKLLLDWHHVIKLLTASL